MKKFIIAAVFFLAFAAGAQAQQSTAEANSTKHNSIVERAQGHMEANRYKEAAMAYTEAMQYNVDTKKTIALRAQAYYLNQDYKLAIADLDKLIDAEADDMAELYFLRGASKLGLQDEQGACADLKQAKALGKEVKEAYYEICE